MEQSVLKHELKLRKYKLKVRTLESQLTPSLPQSHKPPTSGGKP